MFWHALASYVVSIAALAAVALLWRRVRRLEKSALQPKNPPGPVPMGFQTMELTLEAMLEELESKCQEVLGKIDRRERELRGALMQTGVHVRELQSVADEKRPEQRADASDPAVSQKQAPAAGAWQEKSEAILRLADEGLDVIAIAQRLGLGKGEVQLVLDLRKPAQ